VREGEGMLSKEKLVTLNRIFSHYDQIKAAYLFGSHAANKANKLSDIDIGILLEQGYNKKIKLDILTELAEHFFCDIDLVILNEATLLVCFEIVKHNKIIYKKCSFDAAGYFSLTIRRFLDFRPFLAVQRKYLKERILNG